MEKCIKCGKEINIISQDDLEDDISSFIFVCLLELLLYKLTKDKMEIAYLLKLMVEGFQDTAQVTIPIDMEYKRRTN